MKKSIDAKAPMIALVLAAVSILSVRLKIKEILIVCTFSSATH